MKKLERMLMTYWYSYENEMIDFGMMNFFTGKTAAGKSTIIDALQLMLLGGTNGTFFNKAANSKANRTLRSYLYREHGDDGAAGYNYLRKGPFTAYVALEFSDTEKDNRFTLCFVADCFADLQFEYKWLILTHNGIPEDHFINVKTKIPYTISDLKSRLNSEIGRKNFVVCDTNRQYKEQLCARFGNINGKYFTLLKKAVPFTPIADIEKFITESICDVHSEIEITDMQSDILIYKRLEDDARRTREKIDALENINADSVSFDKAKDTLLTQEYIVDRADEEETLAKEKKLKVEEEKERRHLQEEKTAIEGLTEQIDGLTAEIEKSEEEYHSSDLVHTQQNLEQKIAEAARKIKSCQDALTLAFSRIRTYGRNWKKQLDSLNQTEYVLREGFDPASQKTVDAMAEITEKNLESFDFKASAVTLNQLQTSILEEAGNLNSRLGTLREETALLQTEIHNLEKGIKPYPEYVLRFQKLLQGVTDVRILADLLEIKDPDRKSVV